MAKKKSKFTWNEDDIIIEEPKKEEKKSKLKEFFEKLKAYLGTRS